MTDRFTELERLVQQAVSAWSATHPRMGEVEYCETVAGVMEVVKEGAEMRLQELREEQE